MNLLKQINNQKGASAVEFAIVLPLFIILTFGIIEFGIIMYDKAMITNASREGARFGILFKVPALSLEELTDDINEKVREYLNMDPDPDSTDPSSLLVNLGNNPFVPSIDADLTDSSGSPGGGNDFLKVTVAYTYDFLVVPSFVPLLPQTIDLIGVTTMRME